MAEPAQTEPANNAPAQTQAPQVSAGSKTSEPPAFTQEDINKAVEEAKSEWKAGLKKQLEQAKTEGAKLAKMTAEERKAEEDRIARETFEKDKAEFERKLLVAEVKSQLADKGLPPAFGEMIAGADAETSKTAIETFETEWNKALEAAVEKRMSGKSPNIGGGAQTGRASDFFEVIKENQRI